MTHEEYLDIFDDNMKQIGTASRDDVHAKGLWHQTFHCWIVRRVADDQYVLFQRRGPQKKLYPDTLDITAAGHLLAGETPLDGIREVNEELGIDAKVENLISMGIRCDVAIIGSTTNREFCHTYLLESNIPLDHYNLQADEVAGLVQMKIGDGIDLFSGIKKKALVSGYQVDEQGIKQHIDIGVSVEDIIPRLDRYYLKVFIMAERYFQGRTFIAI